MPTLYTFEAKSIQNYILDSSKLKDMIGASEQIENLCTDGGLLDDVLKVLNLEGQFFRRAGGAFAVQFEQEEEAKRFQSFWSYCVRQQLPGLSFIQNIQPYVHNNEIKEAIKQLNRNNEQRRNQLAADFPLAGPLVARYRRTGGPAVNRQKEETLDAVTYSKRAFKSLHLLQKKVDPKNLYHWPTDFAEDEAYLPKEKIFPLLADNPYIGIIHADGNSLGSVVKNTMQDIPAENYQSAALNFSKALEEATLSATRLAVQRILAKHATHGTEMVMPARPLVVGGDDLSFIVRGDLALSFTETFLEAFEQQTEQAFDDLKKQYPEMNLPPYLTACAGIVFVKSKQPFYQAYDLAESLCRYAKNIARKHRQPDELMSCALAFHRITTSLIDDYETIRQRELTIRVKTKENIVLSMQPYFIGKVNEELTPRFSQLQALADSLKDPAISQGSVRELLNLLYLEHWDLAKQRFARWQENLADNEIKQKITNSLEALTDKEHPNLPGLLKKMPDKVHYSPLGDALAFNSVRRGSKDE
ncbi:MAG: hypothetical protein SVR94_14725 [Pseudomonadota bacterium]|nr:hypothetical protein [Pseudomonadota bacterium]